MPPGDGDLVDQELANLGGEVAQLLLGKVLQISGPTELFEHPVSLRSDRENSRAAAARRPAYGGPKSSASVP